MAEKILVPVDGSETMERTIRYACRLANLLGGKVQRRDCDSCFSGTTCSRSLSGIEIRENASLLTPVSVVRLEAVGKT
jgi:nucleotide-binding universal stress UspA family protein